MFPQYLTESPRYGPPGGVRSASSVPVCDAGTQNWTKKKPPEGLDGLISGVSGLGELDFGLVEGSEVAQGLRFVSI